VTIDVNHSAEAFVSANGLEFCYDTFGEATDPPLILIMGLASQMILWDDDFCALLASQGRYVVRFDNRDIGRSTYLDQLPVPNLLLGFVKHLLRIKNVAPYTLVDMARDTIGVMDALGIAKADVVGASMGGAIVQELAVHFPQRLRTATAIMSSTGDPKLERPTVAAFRALMKSPPRDREDYLAHYHALWVALSGDGYPIDPVRTRRQGEIGYDRGIHPKGAARQFGAILASGNRKKGLRGIDTATLPFLVIQGRNDPLIRPSHGRDLAATVPGAKLEMVAGMGHTLPERCWKQIAGAIAAHAPPAVRA
jgi:pimeloyl-ACP methyl ester carboxylesterase